MPLKGVCKGLREEGKLEMRGSKEKKKRTFLISACKEKPFKGLSFPQATYNSRYLHQG